MSKHDALSGIHSPNRVKHSYTQSINGTPEQVFPLLCPVSELDWAPGWSIDWVISTTGLVEQECMFQTPPVAGAKNASIWIVTRHVPDDFQVEMYKVTPGLTVGKLAISLAASGTDTLLRWVPMVMRSLRVSQPSGTRISCAAGKQR